VAASRGVGEEVSWMQKLSLEGDERVDRQRRLEDAREAFAAHAALYVLVMAALLVLNLFLTGFWWSIVVLVGWGIALVLHYLILRRAGAADAGGQAGTEQRTRTARPAA
jgi:hypothetical protein